MTKNNFYANQAKGGLVFVIMELADNLDMLRYVQRKGYLSEGEIKRYFVQMSQAIEYLHSRSIYHG